MMIVNLEQSKSKRRAELIIIKHAGEKQWLVNSIVRFRHNSKIIVAEKRSLTSLPLDDFDCLVLSSIENYASHEIRSVLQTKDIDILALCEYGRVVMPLLFMATAIFDLHRSQGGATLTVEKNRHGPVGEIRWLDLDSEKRQYTGLPEIVFGRKR